MQLHAYSRETTPLSGTWQALPDQYEQFGDEGAFGGDGIYDPPEDASHPVDAVVDDGYEVAVPGCWNEELSGFEQYEGAMWYARRVGWDGRADRAFLRFGAVNYRADVWLNGDHLGSHEGGFTPFAFEVSDRLEERTDNLLVVRVDDSRADRKLPAARTDWFTFGGITREVDLVTVPRRYLRNVKVETDLSDDEVTLTVRAWVDDSDSDTTGGGENDGGDGDHGGDTAGPAPTVTIPDLDRSWTLDVADAWEATPHEGADETVAGTVYEGTATFDADAVDRWTPDDPQLYDLSVSIEGFDDGDGDADSDDGDGDSDDGDGAEAVAGDELVERVGFRTVSVEGSDVLVNGEQVTLRGISLHEEADGRGRSLRSVDRAKRFDWIEDLNCNFARLAHYPHHEAMARRADEAGVLLWTEVPAYWWVEFGDADVQANYRQQLREVVQRDWNRPSVALWSIANETDHEDETRNELLPEIAEYVRSLDDTRLVTAACFVDETDKGEIVVADPLADHLDVFGVNEYRGWYHGEADDFERFDDDPSGPPVLITEVGAGAKRGNDGPADERWTEQSQAEFYRRQLDALDGIEQCCGLSPWILFDFRSPRRQNPYQRGYNRKGLLDENGREKQAFDVLRRYYDGQ